MVSQSISIKVSDYFEAYKSDRDLSYEINYTTIQKQKRNLKVHPLNVEKPFNGIGQSSVNALLNNSLSVNPLPLTDIMKVHSLRGKTFW